MTHTVAAKLGHVPVSILIQWSPSSPLEGAVVSYIHFLGSLFILMYSVDSVTEI